MDLSDLADRATITVPEAGEILGIGRDAAYAAAEKGEIPTLRMGRRLLVPVPALLAMLGVPETRSPESPVEVIRRSLADARSLQSSIRQAMRWVDDRVRRYEKLYEMVGGRPMGAEEN